MIMIMMIMMIITIIIIIVISIIIITVTFDCYYADWVTGEGTASGATASGVRRALAW